MSTDYLIKLERNNIQHHIAINFIVDNFYNEHIWKTVGYAELRIVLHLSSSVSISKLANMLSCDVSCISVCPNVKTAIEFLNDN